MSALNLVTWTSQRLSTASHRTQSDINLGSAHLFVTPPRLRACRFAMCPSRLPRERPPCPGSDDWWPAWDPNSDAWTTGLEPLAEVRDTETVVTTMTCPVLSRAGTSQRLPSLSSRALLRLGFPVQVAVDLRSHCVAVPSCPMAALGSDSLRLLSVTAHVCCVDVLIVACVLLVWVGVAQRSE